MASPQGLPDIGKWMVAERDDRPLARRQLRGKDARTGYRIGGFVDLDNDIVGDPLITTGDHDGRALMLHLED